MGMRTKLAAVSGLDLQPGDVDMLAKAFDLALTVLGPEGHTAEARNVVSDAILAAAAAGERDLKRLVEAGESAFQRKEPPLQQASRPQQADEP
jgi:hypothetical protein